MKKILLISMGMVCLVLGGVGLAIPILPTTPFVLLAAGCFASGSERLYQWLLQTKYFGEFIENYHTKTGVKRATKVRALVFLYIMMAISCWLVPIWHVRLLLLVITIAVTIHIFMIKTRKQTYQQAQEGEL